MRGGGPKDSGGNQARSLSILPPKKLLGTHHAPPLRRRARLVPILHRQHLSLSRIPQRLLLLFPGSHRRVGRVWKHWASSFRHGFLQRCARWPPSPRLDGPRYAALWRGKTCWAGAPRATQRTIRRRLLYPLLHLRRGVHAGGPIHEGRVWREAGPAPCWPARAAVVRRGGAVVRRCGDGVSRRASRGQLRFHVC